LIKFFLFLLLISNLTLAAEVKLFSTTSDKVSRGEIVKFNIETTLEVNELLKYQNSRVDELLYILSIKETDKGIVAEAIIAEKGVKEKFEKPNDQFFIYNLDFVPTKKNSIKELIVLYTDKKSSTNILISILIALSFLVLIFLIYYIKNRKQNIRKKLELKKWKENQDHFIIKLKDAKSRKDIEDIYMETNKLNEFFELGKNELDQFINIMNKIQYKKSWTENELEEALKVYKSFHSSIEVKNGI
jgi:hypothetical protein